MSGPSVTSDSRSPASTAAAIPLRGLVIVVVSASLFGMLGPLSRFGRVTGLDLSEAMLGVANTRARDCGHSIDYHVGSAEALPFADATFDAARTERLLQYLDDPARAVAPDR